MGVDVEHLVEGALGGSRSRLARAVTLVESTRDADRPQALELLHLLRERRAGLTDGPFATRVGISGAPGVGKSTFINTLGVRLVEQGHRVAVLAIDPSSPKSGGSVLGDRTRMADLAGRVEAFVRPSPAGRELGGVARATADVIEVVEAAGFDVVLVETVGVGQSEVAVADLVDTLVLLTLARSGDQVQGIKRGILELADVVAVAKADGDGAGEARASARELGLALRVLHGGAGRSSDVLTCSALTGEGIDEVWQAVLTHRERLVDDPGLAAHRGAQQARFMWSLAEARLVGRLRVMSPDAGARESLEARVASGEITATEGAEALVRRMMGEW